MPEMKNAVIRRCGVTARYYNLETSSCTNGVSTDNRALHLHFYLKSKGGGTTQVAIDIGYGDIESIVRELATNLPECASLLSDCASIASTKNRELLENAAKSRADEKTRLLGVVSDLESVKDYIFTRSYQALGSSVGNKKEAELMQSLYKAIAILSSK